MYLNTDNIATQDDLYRSLVSAIEPILEEERQRRQPIEDKFVEDIKVHVEVFEMETKPDAEKAEALLAPKKAKLNADIEALKVRFAALIEKKVKAFDKEQTKVKTWYDAQVGGAKSRYDDQIAPFKAARDEALKVLVGEIEEKIAPINAEYRDLAAKMEEATNAGLVTIPDTEYVTVEGDLK